MTVPLVVNSAAVGAALPASDTCAERVTVSVEPLASAIWLATVRFQINSYNANSPCVSFPLRELGRWNTSPAGRIASCASWAPFDLPVYTRGFSGSVCAPYSSAACDRAACTACFESEGESVRMYVM